MDTLKLISDLESLFLNYGYIIIFLSSFIETSPLGFAVPGGILLFVGGFFAYETKNLLFVTIIFGWLGTWATLLISYYLGFSTGFKLVEKIHNKSIIKRVKSILKKRGGLILTTAMISNLTRFWVAYIAGVEKVRFINFLVYSAIASLLWNILIPILGFIAGSERENIELLVRGIGFLGWLFIFVSVGIILLVIKKELKNANGQKK